MEKMNRRSRPHQKFPHLLLKHQMWEIMLLVEVMLQATIIQ